MFLLWSAKSSVDVVVPPCANSRFLFSHCAQHDVQYRGLVQYAFIVRSTGPHSRRVRQQQSVISYHYWRMPVTTNSRTRVNYSLRLFRKTTTAITNSGSVNGDSSNSNFFTDYFTGADNRDHYGEILFTVSDMFFYHVVLTLNEPLRIDPRNLGNFVRLNDKPLLALWR